MPMTLTVGLQKKVGLPDYGSLGASCQVELELDGGLLFADPNAFQQKATQAFAACNQAVNDELSRQQAAEHHTTSNGSAASSNHSAGGNGRVSGQARGQPRRATASQVRALEAIARRNQVDLARLLQGRFGVQQASDMSITEASNLIDELKASAANGGRLA